MELDCTNYKTTLETVSSIVGLTPNDLTARLREIPNIDMAHPDPYERVPRALFESLGPGPLPDSIIWFHATRIPRDTTFSEGLLPASLMRPVLEQQLRELAAKLGLCPKDHWEHLPREGHDATRLRVKAIRGHWDDGPHGFLFREMIKDKVADADSSNIADYTREPEIVREMCFAIQSSIGRPLLNAYRATIYPAIVKFKYAPEPDCRKGMLKQAINYLHARVSKEEPWAWCSGACSCKGNPVPRNDILEIEFL